MFVPTAAVLLTLACHVRADDVDASGGGGGRFTRRMTPATPISLGAGGGSHQEEVFADVSPRGAERRSRRRKGNEGNNTPSSSSSAAAASSSSGLLRGLSSPCALGSGRSTYVSPLGSDDVGSGMDVTSPYRTLQYAVDNHEPCETVNVMEGTYHNEKYGTGQNHYKSVINLSGVTDGLTIAAYAGGGGGVRPKLKFDGPGGVICNSNDPCENVDISGLEIEGPNADITYQEAIDNRNSLDTLVKFTGRGVAVWKGSRITLRDMVVHHCPGSGMRVNKGDYVSITDSVVYDNTWWSPRAESAIVFAESLAVDASGAVKMTIARNEVYGNVNKIPYYNPNYDWDYSPIGGLDCGAFGACDPSNAEEYSDPTNCPWQCRYGKATQDFIIDGMGVYVTRNKDTYLAGQMELADNVCRGNGINGLVFHRTDRGYVRRNVVYDNGVVPAEGHPEPTVEDWHPASDKCRQKYSGLVLNNAAGVKLWSNNVAARYDDDYAFKQEDDSGVPTPVENGGNNKACRGLVQVDPPQFVVEVEDLTVCGIEEEETTTTTTTTTTVPPAFVEVSCADRCHLIQWPYSMHASYPPASALVQCEGACESGGDCRAFSLQWDYDTNDGYEKCFLYRDSGTVNPKKCRDDPFNTNGCWYSTQDGSFFIRPEAREEFNVLDVGVR